LYGGCSAIKVFRSVKDVFEPAEPALDTATIRGLAFRDMTLFAEKKVDALVQNILKARARMVQGIPRYFSPMDWRDDAITRFFRDYALDSGVVLHATTVLQTIYASSDTSPCFREALRAVSFASQANQLSVPFMAAEASTWYGKSLSSLARVLQDPVESLRDSTLATPYLVGWYEVCSFSLCMTRVRELRS
jgi:hypothetical protein